MITGTSDFEVSNHATRAQYAPKPTRGKALYLMQAIGNAARQKPAVHPELGMLHALKTGWIRVCRARFTTGEEKS
jgi:hypothetical protein